MTSFWRADRVTALLIDSDADLLGSASTDNATENSLKMDGLDDDGNVAKRTTSGLATNVGGGGLREGLASETLKLQSACLSDFLIVVACFLHAISIMMFLWRCQVSNAHYSYWRRACKLTGDLSRRVAHERC